MATYYGTLSINANQSKLDMALLLMDGFPDPTQAMYRATLFLQEQRHLQNGEPIWVSGTGGAMGTISYIVMDDAGAIPPNGPNLSHAFAPPTELMAAMAPAKKKAVKEPAKTNGGTKQ